MMWWQSNGCWGRLRIPRVLSCPLSVPIDSVLLISQSFAALSCDADMNLVLSDGTTHTKSTGLICSLNIVIGLMMGNGSSPAFIFKLNGSNIKKEL